MTARSATFERFRQSLERMGARERFDAFDLEALRHLQGEERALAEALLVERLREENDGRAAEALAAMNARTAIAPLEGALARLGPGAARVAVARALETLRGDDAAVDAVVDTLEKGSFSERASAARALARFPGARAEAALRTALGDRHAVVRTSAAEALLELHGLAALAPGHWTPLGLAKVMLASDLAPVRDAGRARIDAAVTGASAGQSPASLGLERSVDLETEPFRSLVATLQDDAARLDLGTAHGVDAFTRGWMVGTLLASWHDDPRVPGALARFLALDEAHGLGAPTRRDDAARAVLARVSLP